MPSAEGELCAQTDTTPQDPHGHGCQGGCDGWLHGICGSVVDDDNENHRICPACVAEADKRKAPAADSAGRAQSKRPKATNGGSRKWTNGCLIFRGALPVVLVIFFSCNIEAGAPGRQGRICPDVVRVEVTAVVVARLWCVLLSSLVRFLKLFFLFIFILQHRSGQRGVGFSFVRTRDLQAVGAVPAFSGA